MSGQKQPYEHIFHNSNRPDHKEYAAYIRQQIANAKATQGKLLYSITSQLIKETSFGKSNMDHSFISEPVLESSMIIIFKSGYLVAQDVAAIKSCRVDLEILDNMINWVTNVDFSIIRDPSNQHLTQDAISEERVHLLGACSIYYDLHISLVIRYLG